MIQDIYFDIIMNLDHDDIYFPGLNLGPRHLDTRSGIHTAQEKSQRLCRSQIF